MESRRARRRPSNQVSSFYDRFGLIDPREMAPGKEAPSNTVYMSGASVFGLLKRLAEIEGQRERRMGRLFGRDGYTPFRRMGEKTRGLAPFAMGAFGAGDFLLIRPSTQMPAPVEDPLVEQAVRRTPTRKPKLGRQPKVRTSRAVRHALSAEAPKAQPRGPKLDTMATRSSSRKAWISSSLISICLRLLPMSGPYSARSSGSRPSASSFWR